MERNIRFLGFLDRREQLVILKNTIAVIQPSLFEGWSTVVEDTKALNKHIILSDLTVHKEQIQKHCDFFERKDEKQLAGLLRKYSVNNPSDFSNEDYVIKINDFGKDFMDMINE